MTTLMRYFITTIVLLFAVIGCKNLFAQQDSVKYTQGFKFHDGIYKTFEDFKNNNPSIKERAVISENPEAQFLLGNFATMEKISFYDSNGISHKLKRTEVWGYCSNGAIYVMLNNNFHRIFKIGRIIHLTESHNTLLYSNSAPVSSINKPVRLIQYLIDYRTGEILSYTLDNFLLLLKADEQLYDEFTLIKRKSRKQEQMFIYLNKFNERNPIYFIIGKT